jgi:prolyl-tRNA synthetase
MRWSQAFIPTLRDDPADAEAVSHKLLLRGGFARQLMAGVYSLLPLGQRVRLKIIQIIRDEMNSIGGQEFLLPSMHPRDVWEQSGRWDSVGPEIFTHVATEMRSYKQLPQIFYQFQAKFRDEARPKSGLLRLREFTMKDSYSFDADEAGLDAAFDRHFDAYRRIFNRIGFDAIAVEASSGMMGGNQSIEFMLKSAAGEDWIASCEGCGYAGNVEKATSKLPLVDDGEASSAAPEKFPTPGVRTIEDLEKFEGGAPGIRQIKTLVYQVDDKIVLLLLRGCDTLSEQKLLDSVEGDEIRPATADEIRAALGASPGSLGAVGVDLFVVADEALQGRTNMTTGANEDDHHLRAVDIERDIEVKAWLDLREVEDGETCPMCEKPLAVFKTIEVGHIFKLGTKYSDAMDATVLDRNGVTKPVVMGCYGIGVERNLAAIVEAHHDEAGIVWPMNVAPFEVVVSVVKPKDVGCAEAGERLYEALQGGGIDVLIDDRDERPGVKFKDADLVGIPYRLTVGPKGLADGVVELRTRRTGESRDLPIARAAETVIEAVLDERR